MKYYISRWRPLAENNQLQRRDGASSCWSKHEAEAPRSRTSCMLALALAFAFVRNVVNTFPS